MQKRKVEAHSGKKGKGYFVLAFVLLCLFKERVMTCPGFPGTPLSLPESDQGQVCGVVNKEYPPSEAVEGEAVIRRSRVKMQLHWVPAES